MKGMKDMEYQIKNDLKPKEYNELRNSVGWDSKDEKIIQNAITNSAIVKKIIINNKVVGMARAIGDGLYYLIVDVVVNQEFQGKGLGKILIEEIVKEVYNKTKEGQKASINLISMQGKEEFYEKCGFRKIPFDFTGYGMIRRIEK
jgi:GNAT superfamily N-acetyltransferase